MPLVDIKCKPKLYPAATAAGTKSQQATEQFGQALPALFVSNDKKLGLSKGTPEAAVQVEFSRFHTKSINAPDMWVKIHFSEPYPGKKKAQKVREKLRKLFSDWYEHSDYLLADIAVDLIWGPTHGYLAFGDTYEEW